MGQGGFGQWKRGIEVSDEGREEHNAKDTTLCLKLFGPWGQEVDVDLSGTEFAGLCKER